MKKQLDIKILYLSLHNLLKNRYGVNRVISVKEMFCELGKHFLVKRNLRYFVIKEMVEMNLLSIENRDNIKILDYDIVNTNI